MEIICATTQSFPPDLCICLGGDHDDDHARVVPLKTVNANKRVPIGQFEIQDDGVESKVGQFLFRFGNAGRYLNLVSALER